MGRNVKTGLLLNIVHNLLSMSPDQSTETLALDREKVGSWKESGKQGLGSGIGVI